MGLTPHIYKVKVFSFKFYIQHERKLHSIAYFYKSIKIMDHGTERIYSQE